MNNCINTRQKRLNEVSCGYCYLCTDPIADLYAEHNCTASPFGDPCKTCEKYMKTFGHTREAVIL